MSRPHDAQRISLPFGNPFRSFLPKGSYPSAKLLTLLSSFEQTLAESLKKLKPKSISDVLSLRWIRQAMLLLSETHTNINTLITSLQFPVSDWDEKWMDMYLDNSVKLLDLCNGLTSELSKLDQSQLFLKYALHMLSSSEKLERAHSSLHDWMEKIHSKNPKLENCSSILQELTSSLHLVKVKNSSKGKVLMRALYGVKVVTIFISSVFTSALFGSMMPSVDLHVSGDFLWAQAFNDLNGEIKKLFSPGKFEAVKELREVNVHVEKLHNLTVDANNDKTLALRKESTSDLGKSVECFAFELDLLSKELDEFFRLILAGRNVLLSSLMASGVQSKGKADKFR